jgi:hypothetical protein
MKFGDLIRVEFGTIPAKDQKHLSLQKTPTLNHQVTLSPEVGTPSAWQLNVLFENDIFDNRDYYYTNGLQIELEAPFLRHSPFRKILPGLQGAEMEQNGLYIAQRIFTPTNPDTTIILHDDHPFSAYLVAGQYRDVFHLAKKLRIRSAITLGVIGPLSLGQQVQTSIHEIKPVGWLNQVSNDFILDYALLVEKGLLAASFFELNAMGAVNVGTLYNRLGAGLNLRLGNFMPFFKGPATRSFSGSNLQKIQYWIFAESQMDLIGYDATLQGGMFAKENVYVVGSRDIERFVFQSSIGFAFYYDNIGIEYRHFYQTPRFRNAYHFGWGSLKAVLTF